MRNWKLASAVVMALGAQAAYAELSVTPAVVSDYDFRGITQTALDPALQLSAAYTFSNGIYVATFASTLDDDSYPDAHLELDGIIGISGGDPESSVGWDVGFIYYGYPGNGDFDWQELYAGISKGWFSAKLSYSPEFVGLDDSAFYLEGNGTFPLPHDFSLVAHVGYSFGDYWDAAEDTDTGNPYVDFAIGIAKTFGNVDVSLKYIDGSDLKALDGTPGDVLTTEGKVWLSVSTTFPWGK